MRAKIIRYFLFAIGALITSFISLKWGSLVSMSTQLEIIGGLRDTASLILGVLGVWVAIVYPESLSNMFKRDKKKDDSSIVGYIFFAIRTSTFIVLYTIIANFLYPIAIHIPYLADIKILLKTLSILIIGLSSFTLFVSLFLSLLPLEMANLDIESIKESEKQLDLKHQNRKK